MSVKVKVDIPTAKILKVRGLGSSKDAQRFLASTVVKFADPYVPMSSGAGAHMKNQTQIPQDGAYILYGGGAFPYTHYQFVGKVMAGSNAVFYNSFFKKVHLFSSDVNRK